MNKNKHFIVAHAYDKRGRLIARASNSYSQTHPIQAKYAKMAGKPLSIFLHAEIACLLRTGTKMVHRLTVERYNKKGEPVLAKPCSICELAIKDWDVRVVEYTPIFDASR